MKKILAFVSLFLIFLIPSCTKEKQNIDEISQISTRYVGLQIANVSELPSKLYRHTEKKAGSNYLKNIRPDLSNSKIVSYLDVPIRSIITPLINIQENNAEVYHVYFEKEGLVSLFDLVMTIEDTGHGGKNIKFESSEGEFFLSFSLKNNLIGEVRKGELSYQRGWWTRFGNCVKFVMDEMADGSPENVVVSLICLYYSPYCAVSITAMCALLSSEGYFEQPQL